MNFFNAVVYSDANKIKVKIEHVMPVENPEVNEIETVRVSTKSFDADIFQSRGEIIKYPLFIADEIISTQLERTIFKAQYRDDEPKEFYRDAVIYELPSNPAYFLNFVRVMDKFTHCACSFITLSKNHSIDDDIKDGELKVPLDSFFSSGCLTGGATMKMYFEATHPFIYNILSLVNTPQTHQESLQLLKNIMERALDRYIHEKRNFNNNLVNNIVLNFMIAGRDPYILLKLEVPEVTKNRLVADLYDSFSKAGEREELAYLFKTINFLAIKALYELCLGRPAPDGGVYRFEYTEWYFLACAKFTIRPDGRMSIIDLCQNEGYKQHYAKGCLSHEKFEIEMRHLGKVLNLEFAADSNFHEELIFTEKSTQALKAKGVHYNQLYLNKLSVKKDDVAQSRNTLFKPKPSELKDKQSHPHKKIMCAII